MDSEVNVVRCQTSVCVCVWNEMQYIRMHYIIRV